MCAYRRRDEELRAEGRQRAARAPGDERAEALLSSMQRRPSVVQNWVKLSVLLILVGLVLREYALFVLPIFLLVSIGAAAWWNGHVLDEVFYRRRITRTRAFPGETIEIDILVENAKLLPVPWLRVEDTLPQELPVSETGLPSPAHPITDALVNVYSLRWFDRVHRHYVLSADQRGVFALGPAYLRAGDVFGMFHTERTLGTPGKLVIYPRVAPLEELGIPPKEPLGDMRSRYQWMEDPSRTMGARDFRPGDSFRHIHWPATARRQALQTRIYEPTTSLSAVMCVDVATLPKAWQGILPDLLEDIITVAASLAHYAAEHRYGVGLIANGAAPHSDQAVKVMPGRAPDQLARVLESLAGVTGFVTDTMDKFLLKESPMLPWGATLVVITAIVKPELLATIQRLQTAGRRIVLVSLGGEPPPLAGVIIHHIPSRHVPHYEEMLQAEGER